MAQKQKETENSFLGHIRLRSEDLNSEAIFKCFFYLNLYVMYLMALNLYKVLSTMIFLMYLPGEAFVAAFVAFSNIKLSFFQKNINYTRINLFSMNEF